jgi:hypothetical protein
LSVSEISLLECRPGYQVGFRWRWPARTRDCAEQHQQEEPTSHCLWPSASAGAAGTNLRIGMLQANQSHTANIRANEDLAQDDLAECGPVNDVSVVFDRSTVRKPPSIFLTIDPTIYADWFWWRRPLASPLRNVENGAARNAPFLLQCAINSTWVGSELKDSVSNCTRSGYPPSLSPSMVAFPKVTLGKGALGAWEDIYGARNAPKKNRLPLLPSKLH